MCFVLSLQLSLNVGLDSSSVAPVSALTQHTSVMETMTAKTTLTKPIAVHTPPYTYLKSFFLLAHIITHSPCYLLFGILLFPDIHVCLPSQFKCSHPSRCIPGIFRCNGQDNCGEGEDEKDCRKLDHLLFSSFFLWVAVRPTLWSRNKCMYVFCLVRLTFVPRGWTLMTVVTPWPFPCCMP